MISSITKIPFLLLVLVLFFSCSSSPEVKTNKFPPPKVVDVKAFVVSGDSILSPVVINIEQKTIPLAQTISVKVDSGFYRNDEKAFSYFKDKIGQNYDLVKYIGGESALYIPRSIVEDKKGNIWFASIGGVSFFDGEKITFINTASDSAYKVVNEIIEDGKGNIFYSTGNGRINKYDGKSILRFKTDGQAILSSLEDKGGRLWFCGYGGVRCYDGINFTHFKSENGLSANSVNKIITDRAGKLWLATWCGGITSYDGKTFVHFTEKQGLNTNNFYTIADDDYGNLWFGSYGKGATCYNGKTFTTYTKEQGLANDTLSTIFQDKAGNLWFGTFNGLSKISAEKLDQLQNGKSLSEPIFQNYGVNEGIKKGSFQPNSVCEDRNGNIWWGTSNGLLIYHPDRDKTVEHPSLVQQSIWWKTWWFWTTIGIIIIGSINGYFRYKINSRRTK